MNDKERLEKEINEVMDYIRTFFDTIINILKAIGFLPKDEDSVG